MGALSFGEIATDEDDLLPSPVGYAAATSEQISDGRVELATLVICRADNQHALTCLACGEILARDCLVPVFGYGDLAHSILTLEERQSVGDPAFGGECDSQPKVRVALAPDDFEAGDGHACLLHLIEGAPRFDCMMLPLVAEKDDAIDALIVRLVEKPVHLPRGKEAGFVHDPELLLAGRWRWILHKARDSPGVYARF
jgi:hypothetical protein